MSGTRLVAVVLVAAALTGCSRGGAEPSPPPPGPAATSGSPRDGQSSIPGPGPLAGKVVVIDPGHQLGNRQFRAETATLVDAGGFEKACNATGAATASGYPEATFTWQVALAVRKILRRLGARVVLTRTTNSDDRWGPCVDERGRIGNPGERGPTADVRVSIHADGRLGGSARGFHVIAPASLPGWTDDIERPSARLARDLRDALVAAGFAPANYVGARGIDVRRDLGTLNRSDIPAVMAELGNMRDARDAAVLESPAGQRRFARAVAAAIRTWLVR